MIEQCDHKSVGVIIQNAQQDVLLLERARFPFGLAPPAGHVDSHGSLEQTAIEETFEEVGLAVPLAGLRKVVDAQRVEHQCRRPGGDYHVWTVYKTRLFTGELQPSIEETNGAHWVTLAELQVLSDRPSQASTPEQGAQFLEPIWRKFFIELGLVKKL